MDANTAGKVLKQIEEQVTSEIEGLRARFEEARRAGEKVYADLDAAIQRATDFVVPEAEQSAKAELIAGLRSMQTVIANTTIVAAKAPTYRETKALAAEIEESFRRNLGVLVEHESETVRVNERKQLVGARLGEEGRRVVYVDRLTEMITATSNNLANGLADRIKTDPLELLAKTVNEALRSKA